MRHLRLRALLIQKDAKRHFWNPTLIISLRALLIQKDAKRFQAHADQYGSLRALLIQKDAKLVLQVIIIFCV